MLTQIISSSTSDIEYGELNKVMLLYFYLFKATTKVSNL